MAVAPRAERATGRAIAAAARAAAYAGGVLLSGLALMTVASIVGRRFSGLGLGPIPGDYELVAHGVALSVFAFLPWCQLTRGHVTVDLLIDRLPPRGKAAFGLVADALVALASLVILAQLWRGFGEKLPYGSDALRAALGMGYRPFFPETTYELEIPTWIPYGAAVLLAALFAVTALYTAWRSLNWTLSGREALDTPAEMA
jgi:TRAP-type C4-dicarboxylate transport system permease small subunit